MAYGGVPGRAGGCPAEENQDPGAAVGPTLGPREGDPKDLPRSSRSFTDGWQLGKPDLILKMPEAFTIPASTRDTWRGFVLPTGLKEDRTVAAIEFRPGSRHVVHHAVFGFDTTGAARKKDEEDPGPGFRSSGADLGVKIDGHLGGWVPGSTPRRLPEGVGRKLPRGSDLVVQVHYKPSGKEEKDQSTVGIFFSKKPPRQQVRVLFMREGRLRIPAGEKRHRVAVSYKVPVYLHAVGIIAHMHLLGREMKVTATLPSGRTKPLLWINDWDFNWQGQYVYSSPVALPRGTVIDMEAFFDNSSDNSRNPNNPPKTVWEGPRTADEMCGLRIQVVIDQPRPWGRALACYRRPGAKWGDARGPPGAPTAQAIRGGGVRKTRGFRQSRPEPAVGTRRADPYEVYPRRLLRREGTAR